MEFLESRQSHVKLHVKGLTPKSLEDNLRMAKNGRQGRGDITYDSIVILNDGENIYLRNQKEKFENQNDLQL